MLLVYIWVIPLKVMPAITGKPPSHCRNVKKLHKKKTVTNHRSKLLIGYDYLECNEIRKGILIFPDLIMPTF